jgi:hypothetical protein
MSKKLSDKLTSSFNRRRCLKLLGGGVLLTAGSVAYAFCVEPDRLCIEEVELPVLHLPSGFDGYRVLQISDTHFELGQDEVLMEKMMTAVKELAPDLILFTGDYITRDEDSFADFLGYVGKLSAKDGIFGVMGNHDVWYSSYAVMKPMFERAGVSFLRNQNSLVWRAGEKLRICGLDSVWGGEPLISHAYRGVAAKEASLLMMHEPDFFDEVAKEIRYFTQFSGHTHGGQCRVPLIGYAPVKIRYGKKYIRGSFEKRKDQSLYVSSGIGTGSLRVRFACPPELVLFTLKVAQVDA